jgi:hypothetical protein
MRLKSAGLAALLLACAAPARAQYITPFSSWIFNAPVPWNDKNGADPAKPAAGSEACVVVPHGRDGLPRDDCKPTTPGKQP